MREEYQDGHRYASSIYEEARYPRMTLDALPLNRQRATIEATSKRKDRTMTAKIRVDGEAIYVAAAPAGEYGFGTIGAATPDTTLNEAWRMVQRAGLAKVADRSTGYVSVDGATTRVYYEIAAGADLREVPDRAWDN